MSNHPSTTELWSPLENAEIPERAEVSESVKKAKLNQEQQKKIDAELWSALDARNLEEVKKAIEGGARIEMRRQGGPAISALYVAFEKNYQEIALFLMEQGADIQVLGTRKQSLPSLAVEHDSPELLGALVDRGLDVTKSIYWYRSKKHLSELCHNSPKVIQWWLDKQLPLSFKNHTHLTDDAVPLWISTWSTLALRHYKTLFHPIVNQIHQEAPKDWQKIKGWDEEITQHWGNAFQQDNAELIRFMVKQKWTPPATYRLSRWTVIPAASLASTLSASGPGIFGHASGQNKQVHEDINIFWKAVSARAVRCMDLLLTSSAMKEWVQRDLEEKKEMLLEVLPLHIPTLEKLLPLGLDLTMASAKGTLLHHHSYDVTKGVVEWLVKKAPDILLVPNTEGKTVFDSYTRGGVSTQMVEKMLLQRNIEKAPRKSKKNPPKLKARL